jgi:hypothetical protein
MTWCKCSLRPMHNYVYGSSLTFVQLIPRLGARRPIWNGPLLYRNLRGFHGCYSACREGRNSDYASR